MSISDVDLELLEAHLDRELSKAEEANLIDRLASDHELASELLALRADRALRLEVFEALEPDELAVSRLLQNVRKQVTRDTVEGERWGNRLRIMRYIGSAAACVMISFSAGWLGRSHATAPNPNQSLPALPAQSIAQQTALQQSGSIDFGQNVQNNLSALVSNTRPPQPAQANDYVVQLTDAFGHVVATQRFYTRQEADEFSNDVNQWERQQQQMRGAEPADYNEPPSGRF